MDEDGIMEIVWKKNAPVSQSQRSIRKTTPSDVGEDLIPADESTRHQGRPQSSLFVQEDEMASWLHYPLHGTGFPSEFCSDFLYAPPPCVSAAETRTAGPNASVSTGDLVEPTPPFPPPPRVDNLAHLSRLSRRFDESGPSNSNRAVIESTVVDSSVTPAVPPQLTASDIRETSARGNVNVAASVSVPAASLTGVDSEAPACDVSVTSGGSIESVEPPTQRAVPIALPEDMKRKGQEPDFDGGNCHSEDEEMGDAKKHVRCSSSSTRRSRAAEVHNLSERKRRDRINEKMKTLQELIPNCNKADKASMLDDAIEYLKSLKLQLQMVSMGGCSSMVPTMMFPPPAPQQQQQQHYMMPQQHIGAMGMGMGMGMGINRPMMMMMPYPNNNVLTAAAAGNVGVPHHLLTPRFPMQPPMFHNMQQQQQQQQFPQPGGGGSYHDPTTMLSSSSSNLALNPNMGLADPLYHHHQYLSSLHHLQMPPHPNQELQQSTRAAKHGENLERQPKG